LHANNYCDEKGNPVKNKDRIQLIYDLLHTLGVNSHCIIRKTKGHDGHLGNELADALSKKAAYESECFYKINKTIIQESTNDKPDATE
jgi:ribonuclease HI